MNPDPYAVPCPYCDAVPGMSCRDSRSRPMTLVHLARLFAVTDPELAEQEPEPEP